MSRAYRIRVRQSLQRVIRAADHVSSQLEILEILPADQMADLLAEQLVRSGFRRDGNRVLRQDGDITVVVQLDTGVVTVQAETVRQVQLEAEREGLAYEDEGPGRAQAEDTLRQQLAKSLEGQAEQQSEQLQKQTTDQLEAQLADLKSELDQAVNRATAEALKQKAAKLGQIKQMTEDPQSGSLTIVLEV